MTELHKLYKTREMQEDAFDKIWEERDYEGFKQLVGYVTGHLERYRSNDPEYMAWMEKHKEERGNEA